MDNVGLNTARAQPARQPEPVASGLVADDNALDLATRYKSFSSASSSAWSFLSGWRLTPGTIAATSHFDWLISITAMTVLSCSRVVRDLLTSKGCDKRCSVGLLNSAEGVTPSPLAP